MGLTGKPFHRKTVEATERVVDTCKEAGVALGVAYTLGNDYTKELVAKGFRFIGIGSDVGFLLKGCKNALSVINQK